MAIRYLPVGSEDTQSWVETWSGRTDLPHAIEVTLTTKTFSIVVGSFLVTILLRLLN